MSQTTLDLLECFSGTNILRLWYTEGSAEFRCKGYFDTKGTCEYYTNSSHLYHLVLAAVLHVLGGGSTSDNFDQLSGNDGLTCSVEQNLVLVDHLASVLGGVLKFGQ